MSVLKTYDLSIGYSPDKVLIHDINLEVGNGSFVGLIGQNGVGKSTLIRTMCGLHKPVNGIVEIDSREVGSYTQKEISKKISLVLTGKPDSLNLSVLEIISLGRYPHSNWLGLLSEKDKDKVEEALTLMEINYIADKKLFELSDGQLQKVMIARALAQDTDLIILDEPTSHLDLKNKIEVLDMLSKIAESNKGILITTHEIQLAAQVCKEFWCVDFGKPMLTGGVDELVSSGKIHEYLHLPAHVKI